MADDKFDSDLNFSKILFLHINRALISTDKPALFVFNIEALEDVLSPYFDEEYRTELTKKTNSYGFFKFLDPLMGERENLQTEKRMELTRQKFRALMALAERKGLLLEKTSYGTDEEEDENAKL